MKKLLVVLLVLLILGVSIAVSFMNIRTGEAEYVALGSSYAAGPGSGERAPNSFWPCWRSDSNYPALFARSTGLHLRDVTCSGATTENILNRRQYLLPPQIEAVEPDTKVVTITVGGNDVFYIGNLLASACAANPQAIPITVRLLGACTQTSRQDVEAAFALLPAHLNELATAIHQRAPQARIIWVDYSTLLPEQGACSQIPLSQEDFQSYRTIATRLSEAVKYAAQQTHSELVQASSITRDHSLCSSYPWVFGLEFPKALGAFGPVPFHPKKAAMQAIANALAIQWRQHTSDSRQISR